MLPYLDLTTDFPDVEDALDEPNGLLAAGADLSPVRLINAYSQGVFPWYSDDEPILWWSPDPRMVFDIKRFKPSRSLIKAIKKLDVTVTLNQSFESVITACAAPRPDQPGTWITEEMHQAYCNLHTLGYAHSVEVKDKNEQIIGGIYGVAIGQLFCGESMFSRISNGSKIALSALIGYLRSNNFPLLDCQVKNNHLVSLGALEMTRSEYTKQIDKLVSKKVNQEIWRPKILDHQTLISRAN